MIRVIIPFLCPPKGSWTDYNFSSLTGFSFTVTIFIFLGAILTDDIVKQGAAGREGPFTVLWECDAVHVFLSPWRYYLDVDEYQRGVRVAQMWFSG